MYKVFQWYKNDEWERFMHTVTDWDLETYLDCLPKHIYSHAPSIKDGAKKQLNLKRKHVRYCRNHP
ncbi:MAG: hypothetical protein CM15mP66_02000 [Pseudomonadota bacterium]|nr:MAG: hypothetical protein CM15mP66_02000 [Pseudomonadota bacterium]